ncbi:MAG: SCO1664 family protein [Actinomycetales bacterium]
MTTAAAFDSHDPAPALEFLRTAQLTVEGRLVQASNATLYVSLEQAGVQAAGVYKPVSGERPLWDFPDGTLAGREVSAYLVSEATGWHVVPPTVLREGPFGPGMCQLWIDVDPETDLVDLVPVGAAVGSSVWKHVLDAVDGAGDEVSLVHADDRRLRRMAVLDAVINNADRKGGHVLPGLDGHVYGVDHGICFHQEDKLRTVLWGWAEEPLLQEEREVLTRLARDLSDDSGGGSLRALLREHLTGREVAATRRRLARLLARGRMPVPGGGWPAIPWPAF